MKPLTPQQCKEQGGHCWPFGAFTTFTDSNEVREERCRHCTAVHRFIPSREELIENEP
jgi:hypothetical protein